MPFEVGGFNKPSNLRFDTNLSKGFIDTDFNKVAASGLGDNPYKFTPKDSTLTSRIRFYDSDSLWSRWRRGLELYTIIQST